MNNIMEELVNNILKHSNASEAIITMEERNKELFIEIVDNGDGFDVSKAMRKDGLGLNQIKARIIMMNGSFDLQSKLGEGTVVTIKVPVVERDLKKMEESFAGEKNSSKFSGTTVDVRVNQSVNMKKAKKDDKIAS
jgi:glucose-6-phosphate-specific signal transduction histidine kinase